MKEILEVIKELEQAIEVENKIREKMGSFTIKPTTIRILGQMSLLLNQEVAKRIFLFATQDVDAHISGDVFVTENFRRLLGYKNLEFDFLSTEIWLPKETSYIPIYDSQNLKCEILDPISALVSKAIKAPEKNHALIASALEIYGDELASKIKFYGVNPDIFKQKQEFIL